MKNWHIFVLLTILVFPAFIIAFESSADTGTKIIINDSVEAEAITRDDLKKIFLGKKVKWNSNQSIKIAVLKEGGIHENFLRTYIQKTSSQFRYYWKKLLFTGKGIPPKSFTSEDEIINYVSSTVGAIGYASSGIQKDGIKVITIKD
ncbi:MAG: hypothetical protein GY749_36680 [Desulfobacteraceae bacterium]|nr:hypothetical protein [Desulfobacteraceae bacterium]